MTIERFDIPLDRLTFQARRAGPADGRPVILLHGMPQTSACWTAQLTALGNAGYHAVAFTQRGYSPGARIDDVKEFAIHKFVGDVLGVADALGFDRFDLVGHDLGAGVAWTLATYHPERLRTLTTLSVPHPNAYQDAYHRRISEPGSGDDQFVRSAYAREFRTMARGDAEHIFVSNDCQQLRVIYDGLPADHVAEYLELLGTADGLRGPLDAYRATSMFSDPVGAETQSDPLPPITVPTLFLWSDEDPAIAAAGAYATGEHVLAPYRFVVLEGVDHWIPERTPELFNEELLAHLSTSGVDSMSERDEGVNLMSEPNQEVVLKFIAAAGRGDGAAAASCLAEDAVNVAKGFGKFSGTRSYDGVDYGALMELLPTGVRPIVHTVTAEADRVVVEFEGNAVTSDGKPYCNQYCWVFTMREGLIKQVNEYFCTILTDNVLWPLVEKMHK